MHPSGTNIARNLLISFFLIWHSDTGGGGGGGGIKRNWLDQNFEENSVLLKNRPKIVCFLHLLQI